MNPHKVLGHIQIKKHDEIENAVKINYGKYILNNLGFFNYFLYLKTFVFQ